MVMDPRSFRPPVLVGERVVWLGSGTGLPQGGVVRWIGKLPEMGPDWTVGLQLDNPLPYGGIDGSWGNRHLFTCEPKHGLIVPITKTVREADLLSWPFSSFAGDAAPRHGSAAESVARPQPPVRHRVRAPEPPPQPPARKPVTRRPRPAARRRKHPPLSALGGGSPLAVILEPCDSPEPSPSPAPAPAAASRAPAFFTYPERRTPTSLPTAAAPGQAGPGALRDGSPPASACLLPLDEDGSEGERNAESHSDEEPNAGTLPSRQERGSSLKSVLSGRTFVTCTSGEYSDRWFDADDDQSVYDFFDCDGGECESVELRNRLVSDIYSVVIKRKVETLERANHHHGDVDGDGEGSMSRRTARSRDDFRDHDSSLEEDATAERDDTVPRRAPGSGGTNSASRRERTSSGFFSFFRWFRKGRGDEDSEEDDRDVAEGALAHHAGEITLPNTPSSARLVRTQSSSCGSIDTLFSTATVSSFAFVTPTAYRPYGPALAPEKWISPGPDTDTYRHRVLQRERLREQDRGVTLRRKYHLFGSDTQLRVGLSSPETSPLLSVRPTTAPQSPVASAPPPSSPASSNSTFGRKKRRAPPPPEPAKPYSDYSLPSSWRKGKESVTEDEGSVKKPRHRRAASESAKDKKAGAYCHVKGKRKAPPPPTCVQQQEGGSLDRFRSRIASFGRKKRPAPQPPGPVASAPERQARPEAVVVGAAAVAAAKRKKDQETQAEAEESAGSISKLSPEDRERLLSNISKLKAHANRKSMGSPPSTKKDFYVGLKSPSEHVVCNDSLKLERGVLKPNKDMPKVETTPSSADGKPAPVSPRPWYKRSLSSSKDAGGGLASGLKRDIFKSLEKRKERDREDEWMPEAGIPRAAGAAPPPSDGTSVASTASTASASSSRFNFFARLEEKRSGVTGGEKRRSQLSMLANISELDREAAEIVQKEQAREQALAAAHDAKYYSYPEMPGYPALPPGLDLPATPPPNENVEVPKRSSAKELISLFNAIGNVTKVTVNSAFFSREGSGFFSREGVEKRFSFAGGDSVKTTTTTEEKVILNDSKSIVQKQRTTTVAETAMSSPEARKRTAGGAGSAAREASPPSGVIVEELPSEDTAQRSRALYEAGRARRHHSPSPSIPTIAEQSESTTPASTLDPGSKRSSMADAPAGAEPAPGAVATATGPDALLHAKRITIWTCPRCTLENPRWRITCDACGRWRPAIPDTKLDEEQPSAAIITTDTRIAVAVSAPSPAATPAATSSTAAGSKTSAIMQSASANQHQTTALESPPAKAIDKGGIDWEEELKRYFPKKGVSQTKAKTDEAQTNESVGKQTTTVVQNGVAESSYVRSDITKSQVDRSKVESEVVLKSDKGPKSEKYDSTKGAMSPAKLANPSTFIGGRIKADEKRQGTTAPAAVVPTTLLESPEAQPTHKPDIDEVRKARLAFFDRETDEGTSKEKTPEASAKTKTSDGKPKGKEVIYAGLKLPSDENEKKKLKEMLKEMKDSLPRYPKGLPNGNHVPEGVKSNAASLDKTKHATGSPDANDARRDDGYKRGAIKKILQVAKSDKSKSSVPLQNGAEEKIEAIFITRKTVYEETKVRKGGPRPSKVSTSCQTASVVKKVELGEPGVVPVTVEELWASGVKDGVLYTSLGKPTAPGGSATRAFELIRPRDFANIEATKTAAAPGGAAVAAHVYANVPPSPRAAARAAARQRHAGVSAQQPPTPTPPSPASPVSPEKAALSRSDAGSPARSPLPAAAPASASAFASTSAGSDAATSSSAAGSPPPEPSSCSAASGTASDSSEVERLTAQLTLPKGLADFKADLQAQPPEHNMNTLAVNRLLRRLEAAIAGGQHHQAAVLARDLARLKISCSVTRQRRSVTCSPASIAVEMYVEDKVSHQGPIPLQVIPGMTVAELKQKVEQEFEIPIGVQRWILGKMLAADDEKTLEEHNVTTSGCPMFLYLVAPDGDQEGDVAQPTQPPQSHQESPQVSPQPTIPPPPPPPAEKGGGWYYNHEEDRYSFCEDTESEMATDDEGDDERSETSPEKVPLELQKEMKDFPPSNAADKTDEEEEEEETDDAPLREKLTLIQPSAVIIHDRPVVIEPPAAVAQEMKVSHVDAAAIATSNATATTATGTVACAVTGAVANAAAGAIANLTVGSPNRVDVGTMKLGWKCPVCTLMNSPTRPGCAACTTERPLQYVVPIEYRVNANEMERIRKEAQGDQDLLQAEADTRTPGEQNKHYRELVNLDNTDLVPNTDPFDCSVCFTQCEKNEGVILRDCLHTFCKPCLVNTVQFNEEAEVKCPFRDNNYACDSVLQEREIKALVPLRVYEQHLAKSVAQAENKIGNTFHCKTPDCHGWCIYEDNVNEFRCPVCRVVNCLTCQAMHEGVNCKQYQEQVQQQSETNAEARRTKEMLEEMVVRGEAMACPTCQVVLMKKWGCDWLRCSMCKTEICWVTRGPRWGPGGKGDTTGGCQCGVNGVKCHPRCNYCH